MTTAPEDFPTRLRTALPGYLPLHHVSNLTGTAKQPPTYAAMAVLVVEDRAHAERIVASEFVAAGAQGCTIQVATTIGQSSLRYR